MLQALIYHLRLHRHLISDMQGSQTSQTVYDQKHTKLYVNQSTPLFLSALDAPLPACAKMRPKFIQVELYAGIYLGPCRS